MKQIKELFVSMSELEVLLLTIRAIFAAVALVFVVVTISYDINRYMGLVAVIIGALSTLICVTADGLYNKLIASK